MAVAEVRVVQPPLEGRELRTEPFRPPLDPPRGCIAMIVTGAVTAGLQGAAAALDLAAAFGPLAVAVGGNLVDDWENLRGKSWAAVVRY